MSTHQRCWLLAAGAHLLGFKTSSTNSLLKGYMAETFTIGVFILRRAVLSLRLSASDSTLSLSSVRTSRIHSSPSALCQPACRCPCVFRPEPRRNSYSGDWGDRCSLLFLCWVLKPPDFERLKTGGAAKLIKHTTCKRVIRPFCLMVISRWAAFDGNLCSDYSGVQWVHAVPSFDVCCIKYEVDYKWKGNNWLRWWL